MRKEIYYRLCSDRYFSPPCAADTPLAVDSGLPAAGQTIKTVLADGNPIMANGLLTVTPNEGGMAADGYEFGDVPLASWYNGTNADVLLLDSCMPVPNAIPVIKDLLTRFPHAKIILLSNEDDPGVIRFMRRLGVSAYQIKTMKFNDTLETIVKVYGGEKIFPENLNGGLSMSFAERLISGQPCADLSTRELQVLKMIAGGRTNQQIAAELKRSPLTVKTHRQKLMQKLKACNTAQLISKARLKGFL